MRAKHVIGRFDGSKKSRPPRKTLRIAQYVFCWNFTKNNITNTVKLLESAVHGYFYVSLRHKLFRFIVVHRFSSVLSKFAI